MRYICMLFGALLPLAGCGSSPASPSSTGGATDTLQGRTVSAVDGAASPSLTVQVGTAWTTSDSTGFFRIGVGGPGSHRAVVTGTTVVERETHVTSPANDLRLSLIPGAFHLSAFNEMFRTTNARLQRWTSRPALVVIATMLDYQSGAGDKFGSIGEPMSDDEVNQLVAHLTEGLALLTGNTFTSFASVDVERPAAGTLVSVHRTGRVVVSRFAGVQAILQAIGLGQWLELPDGAIVGGTAILDRDFDRADARRRLLRIHELGHALGYQHVQSTTSIMNPVIGPEPNEFDRAGAIIAFQRPIGNRAPDVDPSTSGSLSVTTGEGARWAGPTVCR